MGLGLNPNAVPELFKDSFGKELPVESVTRIGADRTAFLKIDLKIKPKGGQPVQPMTAAFAPDPKSLSSAVDVLLWFHGDKRYWNASKTDSFSFAGKSIQQYLTFPLCKLREFILKAGKKKFILVAPTLNDQTGISVDSTNPDKTKRNFNPGALIWDQTDAEAYLQQVLNGVQKHMGLSQSLALGNIVLAGHSGGGHLQSQMAQKFEGKFSKLNEVWCFDSSYWGSDPFLKWIQKGRSNAKLFMYSTSGTTAATASAILQKMPNLLGLSPQTPQAKIKPGRTTAERIEAAFDRTKQELNKAADAVWRGIEIAMKTTKIDILIERDPKTNQSASSPFALATYGGMAGGHYECIERYLTKLVETSRNLS
jgi:hypothetical protein